MPRLRLPRRLLRATLVVLLAFGVVVQPTLGALGELHAMEHAIAADGDHGHGHAHAQDADPAHDDDPGFDHAQGAHGLLHQAGSTPASLADAMTLPPAPRWPGPLVPELGAADRPGDVPGSPFRPPIA